MRALRYGLLFIAAFMVALLYYGVDVTGAAPADHLRADFLPEVSRETWSERTFATAAVSQSAGSAISAADAQPLVTESVVDLQERLASEDREQRGIAVRQLARVQGKEAVRALLKALHEESSARNRILAIESLRRSGEAYGDPQWTIRDALRTASEERDDAISAMARDAYDQLVKRLGTS